MKKRTLTIIYEGGAPEKNIIFDKPYDINQYLRDEAWRPERHRVTDFEEKVCFPKEYRYGWLDLKDCMVDYGDEVQEEGLEPIVDVTGIEPVTPAV